MPGRGVPKVPARQWEPQSEARLPGPGILCLWLSIDTTLCWGHLSPVSPAHAEAPCPTRAQHLRAYGALSHPEMGAGWVSYLRFTEEELEGEGAVRVSSLKVKLGLTAKPGLDGCPCRLVHPPCPALWKC